MTQKCDRRDSGSCKNIVLRACWPQTFQHPHRRQQQAMSLRALQLAARQALKEPMGTQLLLQARSYASCTLLPWSSPRPESTAAAFYQTSASSADSTTHSGVLQHLQALKAAAHSLASSDPVMLLHDCNTPETRAARTTAYLLMSGDSPSYVANLLVRVYKHQRSPMSQVILHPRETAAALQTLESREIKQLVARMQMAMAMKQDACSSCESYPTCSSAPAS